MRILFYLEPHPIRNSYTNFLWLKSNIKEMIKNQSVNHESFKIFSNKDNLDNFESSYKNFLLYPLPEEQSFIESMMLDWEGEGVKIWKDLLNGEGEGSKAYYNILKRIKIKYFDFDVIVHWAINGAITKFSKDFGIPCITAELGFMRLPFMNTIMLDDKGIRNSSILNLSTKNLRELGLRGIKSEEVQLLFSDSEEKDIIFMEKKYLLDNEFSKKIISHKNKTILIPLQLEDDSNIVNSRFNSVTSFLEEVLPPLIEKNFMCIIKPHPKYNNSKINFKSCKKSRNYCNSLKNSNVIWYESKSANEGYIRLLSMIDSVITVNSSVGFESIMFDKEVCVLESPPYKAKGVFLDIHSIINDDYNKSQYLEDISILREFLLFSYLAPRDYIFQENNFINRVNDMVNISLNSENDLQWAKNMINMFYIKYKSRMVYNLIHDKSEMFYNNLTRSSSLYKVKSILSLKIRNKKIRLFIFNKKRNTSYIRGSYAKRIFSTKFFANLKIEVWLTKYEK